MQKKSKIKKPKWSKPKLIVLVRSKSEEGLLAGCKQAVSAQQGPNTQRDGCGTWINGGCFFPTCQANSTT